MKPIRLHLVVAACSNNRGIGCNGTLPWKIPGDLAFFKKVTTQTKETSKQNAVIMGRKTWESIPGKFRPLSERLNVVVSTTLRNLPSGVHLANSFDDALRILSSAEIKDNLETIFVIGGASLYKMALESPYCEQIYLTEIQKDFTCDTFLPEFDVKDYHPIELPDVPSEIQMEGDIPYRFIVYKKLSSDAANDNSYPPVAICVAVELGGGFGLKGSLPWPHIKKDYQHFLSLVAHTSNPDRKPVVIKARKTWESTTEDEKESLSSAIQIVVSTTMKICPKNVDYLAMSFKEAIEVALKLWHDGKAEKIWILGGKQVFEEAIDSPWCKHIYLTRILAPFDSDVFFPPFQHCFKFKKILKEELDEESQINIRCELYEKNLN